MNTYNGSKFGPDDIVSIRRGSVALRVPDDCPLGQSDFTHDCIGCGHVQPCLVPLFAGEQVDWRKLASDLADAVDDVVDDIQSNPRQCAARAALYAYNQAVKTVQP